MKGFCSNEIDEVISENKIKYVKKIMFFFVFLFGLIKEGIYILY